MAFTMKLSIFGLEQVAQESTLNFPMLLRPCMIGIFGTKFFAMNKPVTIEISDIPSTLIKQMQKYRKAKPVWAKKITPDQEVQTLEGLEKAQAGDVLCRGLHDELWPQSEASLLKKYVATGVFEDGWQRFDPLPNEPVLAAQVNYPFRIGTSWGEMEGKSGDFLVRSLSDSTDAWIVDQEIFGQTYLAVDE